MNIIKILRKPFSPIFLSLIMLTFSCTQYENDLDEYKSFDYKIYNEFTNSSYFKNLKTNNENQTNRNSDVLLSINQEFETDLSFPNELLNITAYSAEEIVTKALNYGWISTTDLELIDEFGYDLQHSNFDTAINNFEKNVNDLNLNNDDFNKMQLVANNLKSLEEYNPDAFYDASQRAEGWGCLKAVIALVVASISLASCVTIITCGLAVSAWIISYSNYLDNCRTKTF